MMFVFVPHPAPQDLSDLAAYLRHAEASHLHPAIVAQRHRIAGRLEKWAALPTPLTDRQAGAYQALRLFVW